MRYYSSVATPKTLAANITTGAVTQMTLNNLTNLPTSYPYTMVIDPDTANEEIVSVTSLVSGAQVNITRGQDGSSAVAHDAGVTVKHMVTARDLAEPQAHMAATTSVHGITDTAGLATKAYADAAVATHEADTTGVHGIADTTVLTTKTYVDAADAAKVNEVLAINAQTGTTYTFVLADGVSKFTTLNNASAVTVTVPPSVFSAGHRIEFAAIGAGQVTVAAGSGVTIVSTPGLKLRTRYSAGTLLCLASNSFLLVGDLAS